MIPHHLRIVVSLLLFFLCIGADKPALAIDPSSPSTQCDQTFGISVYPKCDDQLAEGPRSTLALTPGFTLAVYYVIPADVEFDEDVLTTLKQSSRDVQAWYELATGGRTWAFSSPEIVQVYRARENRQYYVDNGNWWGSLLTEMGQAGLPIWSPGTVSALWAHGAGFWAGGARGCEGLCGTVLLGVELFPQFNNPAYSGGICPDPDGEGVEAFPCTPVGAYAHELGHPLGLGHPFDDPELRDVAGHSIMATHWNFPDQAPPNEQPWGFLTAERTFIRDNPFLGERSGVAQVFESLNATVNLPVTGEAPDATFDLTVDGNVVRVTAKDATLRDYYWTFGDAQSDHGLGVEHEYSKPGTYTVRLRASNAQSMMSLTERTVVIAPSTRPCGTIRRNTRLTADCLGPMMIGADRVKVNLNGHSILERSDLPGVEVIGRHGVVIRNGTIRGGGVGLLVRDGSRHVFQNLKVYANGESSPHVQIKNVNHTRLSKLTCIAPRFDVTPFTFSGTKSTISRVSCSGQSNNGAIITGSRLTISDNQFIAEGDNALRALLFTGSNSVLRGNVFSSASYRRTFPALFISGGGNVLKQNTISSVVAGLTLSAGSKGNSIRNNVVRVDDSRPDSLAINGGDSACHNTWRNNEFSTDSEGDGEGSGCIR